MTSLSEIITPAERRKVIVIGDSLTEKGFSPVECGWVAGLAAWFNRSADIINRGFSGYNSYLIRALIPKILPLVERKDIILATVFLGANDSVFDGNVQHVPLTSYVENIKAIIHHLRIINADMKIVLLTPPPVDHNRWPNRHDDSVNQYAVACRSIAIELDVPLVNLWEGDIRIDISDLNDGLHFGRTGNMKVLDGVQRVVRHYFPEIVPEDNTQGLPNLSMHFPHWSQVTGITDAQALDIVESWRW